MYTIYGKPNCPFCDAAKQLAVEKCLNYTYVDLAANHEELSRIKAKYPAQRQVPVIELDGVKIGGFTEFKASLES